MHYEPSLPDWTAAVRGYDRDVTVSSRFLQGRWGLFCMRFDAGFTGTPPSFTSQSLMRSLWLSEDPWWKFLS